jgi:hypothetical protein
LHLNGTRANTEASCGVDADTLSIVRRERQIIVWENTACLICSDIRDGKKNSSEGLDGTRVVAKFEQQSMRGTPVASFRLYKGSQLV